MGFHAHTAQAIVFSTDQDEVTIPEELRLPEFDEEGEPYWIDGESCADGSCQALVCDGSCASGGWFFRGWMSQGFTWNPDSPRNRFNSPVTFNDRANEYQLNQVYLSLGKEIPSDCCEWAIGGRVDMLYGTDYFFTQADGLETHVDGSPHWNGSSGPRGAGANLYGWALPQLYAEVFAPIMQGATIKLGHFYTILGYESVMATENFFYSHSYATQYGEPFTHTGLLGSVKASRGLVFHAGFTRGWDNWEDLNEDFSFLGGVTLRSLDDRSSVAFALHTGSEDTAGANNRSSFSLIVTHQISPCMTYVFQGDYGREVNGAINGNARWYGINQYLFYQLCETVELGTRIEWFRDQNNARVLGVPTPLSSGGNYAALTWGLNWTPCDRVTLRPEFRWDWSDVNPFGAPRAMFDDFSDRNQFTLATDLIFRF